jgi:hypothetical protein
MCRFRCIDLFYAVVLVGTSLGTFGKQGLLIGAYLLVLWAVVFLSPTRFRAILVTVVFGVACLHLGQSGLPRQPSPIAQCGRNLRQIELGLANYHEQYKCYPPAYVSDDNGVPQHSWRVLLLPHLGEGALYDSYRFNEPWDGPNNRTLLMQRPEVYACPANKNSQGEAGAYTHYVAVIGPNTMWPGSTSRLHCEISDPVDTTVWVVEATGPGIPWTKPQDLTLSDALSILSSVAPKQMDGHWWEGFFSRQFTGRNVLMADGFLFFVSGGLSRELGRQVLQIDDGNPLSFDDILTTTRAPRQINIGNCARFGLWVVVALWPLPWAVPRSIGAEWGQSGREPGVRRQAGDEEPGGE